MSDFSISVCVATQSEWVKTTGSLPELIRVRGTDLPVTEVSWYEAVSFCNRLSEAEGLRPCYSQSDGSVSWYGRNSDRQLHSVAQKEPNELGLYDSHIKLTRER